MDRREQEIKAQRASLLIELRELRAARAAIATEATDESLGETKKTIKEMILAVLDKREQAGTAEEIIEWIQNDFSQTVVRTSLSPQLSRLKQEGTLEILEDSKWARQSNEQAPTMPAPNSPPLGGMPKPSMSAAPLPPPLSFSDKSKKGD